MLPPPSNAVVTLSVLALNTVPFNANPAEVLAVYVPAPENWVNEISVVPITTGAFVVHTHPVSALVDPDSTNTNALAISLAWSKSVARVNTNAVLTLPTVVTV